MRNDHREAPVGFLKDSSNDIEVMRIKDAVAEAQDG